MFEKNCYANYKLHKTDLKPKYTNLEYLYRIKIRVCVSQT